MTKKCLFSQETLTKKPFRRNNLALIGAVKKRAALAIILVLVILFSIVAGILLFDLKEDEELSDKLYTYPVSVGEETYIITVRSNYSSAPEVSYDGFPPLYSVSVNFRGDTENFWMKA